MATRRKAAVDVVDAASKALGALCSRCPGRDAPLTMPTPARAGHRLTVVYDQPTASEADAGHLSANGYLSKELTRAGVDTDTAAYTAAALCRVEKDDVYMAAKCCRGRLHAELAAAPPNIILPIGAYANRSVFNITGNATSGTMAYRGTVSTLQWRDGKPHDVTSFDPAVHGDAPKSLVTPLMNPYLASRDVKWEPVFKNDVRRVARVFEDGFTPLEWQPGKRIIIATEGLEALALLQDEALALDAETTYEPAVSNALKCFVISDRSTAVVIPWTRDQDAAVPYWSDSAAVAADVTRFFKDRIAVMHNGARFDTKVFPRFGIHTTRIADTLVMMHAVENHLPKSLAFAASTRLDYFPWKQLQHESMEEELQYCGRDGLVTANIYAILDAELDD